MKVCDICGTEAGFDLKWFGTIPDRLDKQEQLIGHFCALHLKEIEDFIQKEKGVWKLK